MAAKKAVTPVVKPAKTAEKVEAPKTAIVKTEDKAATPVAPAKTETAKKEPEKKETVKKSAPVKKAAAKAPAKKAVSMEMHVQYSGKSYAQEELMKMAKDVWRYDLKQKAGDLVSVELYVKPEENTVYYVMNKEFTGSFLI